MPDARDTWSVEANRKFKLDNLGADYWGVIASLIVGPTEALVIFLTAHLDRWLRC